MACCETSTQQAYFFALVANWKRTIHQLPTTRRSAMDFHRHEAKAHGLQPEGGITSIMETSMDSQSFFIRLRHYGVALATVITVFGLLNASICSGQQPNLNRPYEPWQESYQTALKMSQSSGRPVMLVFTGSDWCKTCGKLTEEVFTTHAFAAWSTKQVIKVEVDFPNGYQLPDALKTQNFKLKAKFGRHVRTFPTVLFIDASENVIGKVGYHNGVQEWINAANEVIRPPSDDLVAMNLKMGSLQSL